MKRVQVSPGGELLANVAVDLAGRHSTCIAAADYDRLLLPGRWWLVAFEGDTDQVITETERVYDLGGRRQQRHDTHAARIGPAGCREAGSPGHCVLQKPLISIVDARA